MIPSFLHSFSSSTTNSFDEKSKSHNKDKASINPDPCLNILDFFIEKMKKSNKEDRATMTQIQILSQIIKESNDQ
jgi:hypothetical protein